jgi:hypothetical protein
MHRIVLSLTFVGISMGLVALGCGTDTNGQTTSGSSSYTPPKSVPLEDASLEYAKATCASYFACCDTAELVDRLSTSIKTEADCAAALKQAFDIEPFSYVNNLIKEGIVVYDADKAGTCFGALAATCGINEFTIGRLPACEGIFLGQVADGGDCETDIYCAQTGSLCIGTLQGGTGKCGPLPKENEPCPDYECAPGFACFQDVSGPVCKTPIPDGQMCSTSSDCASEYCEFGNGVCAPKKANGQPCGDTQECKDGWCDMDATKLCTAKKADGAACVAYEDCISDYCNASNQCAPPECNGK